jgi:prevent-host-death family protein
MSNLKEIMRPSADLRNHYNEISRQCREENTAVIITVNGRGDTVSLGYEEYKRLRAGIELLEILAEADENVKYGRMSPVKETFDNLRDQLKEDLL